MRGGAEQPQHHPSILKYPYILLEKAGMVGMALENS